MDRDYEHDDEGVNGHTNVYRRASQRQLEKAPEGRAPRSASYIDSVGDSTVRGGSRTEHDYDGGESTENHTEESLGEPGPAPSEGKFAGEP